ncbi:glutamate--tRNA ligase [Mycoplasma sp. CSL10137]|uniref:glutamate--tRNA ligase n=1 Tax=unclassified Mycoplasma TaxID=2683645 RepID=UPI00197B31CD|nr:MULTISPECIES: glutamate--tRNA ligase [unclassified Mycoplasma]MBN4083449.1 glutamate--tRNA ligase [Mycoplasma sp. CSL10137]MBN4084620.1 glutamate--tRNA ligase [Mycoplasma sp. CSL10166]MBU4693098.1 glutamate--tRNA ligase [Mycoplasma sp. CSL7491-lung]
MKKIRTRYAPSPTGYLHIGGARTALFNYLFAKHYKGDFIFRLEDTDIKRNVVGGEESQLDNLAWLGIIPDESPLNPIEKYGKYRQSEKIDRYREVLEYLFKLGVAYKAYDTTEELEQQKLESDQKGIPNFRYNKNWLKLSDEEKQKRDKSGEYSIRLSIPKNEELSWNDIVRGKISFNSNDITDWVIFKSDGYPTYNFAVVVDDHDMEITHVLRGEEHIGNTPKQLVLYNYLKWEKPEFGHLTIITNMEGKKLSKRDTSLKQFISDYKEEGYIPHGIFNFLTLLGWTSKDGSELMTHDEIIEKFEPERLSKSPSKFDILKMNWFSKQYLKNMNNLDLIKLFRNEKLFSEEWLFLFIDTFKQSSTTIKELFSNLEIYKNPTNKEIEFTSEELIVVRTFKKMLVEKIKDSKFTVEDIQEVIQNVQKELNVKGKKLFMPIRLASTSQEHGPELAKAIYLFGYEFILKSLDKY